MTKVSWTQEQVLVDICNGDGDRYRWGFNGQEKVNEWSGIGNYIDFGTRGLDTRVGRWLSIDPLFKKYAFLSPYSFGANSPLRITDIKGEDIHLLFYTKGNTKSADAMFRAAALTRQYDVEHSAGFDPSKDKVVVVGISDISDVISQTHSLVKKLSPTYGKTTEFGIWSHAALDGPVGSVSASKYQLDEVGGGNQMNMKGWGSINFNWGKNATAAFYGCRTGVGGKESFSSRISGLPNFKNVKVLGQSNYAYPSLYTNYKDNGGKTSPSDFSLFKPNIKIDYRPSGLDNYPGLSIPYQDGNTVDKTYMISSPKHSSGDVAEPMTSSTNGQQTGTETQPGDKKP
jgi:RHS repeat-associated protein